MIFRSVLTCVVLALFVFGTASSKQPVLTRGTVDDLIWRNLAYHAPQVTVLLDQEPPGAALSHLERAGIIVASYTATSCSGSKSAVVMTEKGQVLAAEHGWPVDHNVLVIPVGSLEYVANSASVLRSAEGPYAVRFRFRYVRGANAAILLGFGRALDWSTGDGLTLAGAGRTFTQTVPLEYNAGWGWHLRDEWRSRRTVQC